jgi:16S rRNA processing protein RimM
VPPENLLLIGKIARPHGLDGLLRIRSYAQSEESFLNAGTVFLRRVSGELHDYKVISVKPHKNIFLMKLEGLSSLEDAERNRGAMILIRKASLSPKGKEEYFFHELIGLKVYLNSGKFIGTIEHVLPTGSNDIYVVRKGKKEVLIPAIHDVVEEIDLGNQRMTVFEMEGLLDLNAV